MGEGRKGVESWRVLSVTLFSPPVGREAQVSSEKWGAQSGVTARLFRYLTPWHTEKMVKFAQRF